MMAKNIIIIGAAGRDFHNFNTFYRDNTDYNVVAFTAIQPRLFLPLVLYFRRRIRPIYQILPTQLKFR